MPDLSSNTGGIRSPNPFWLASAPPANSGGQVQRAFDAGWGGAVWKTLGHEPIVPGENPARDDRRCLCGAGVVGRHAYIVRWQNHPGARRWGQFLTRLWRVLP